jgi:hypothetical protein
VNHLWKLVADLFLSSARFETNRLYLFLILRKVAKMDALLPRFRFMEVVANCFIFAIYFAKTKILCTI